MPLSSTTNDIGGAAESAYENFAAHMSWDELTVGLNLADCGTYVPPSEDLSLSGKKTFRRSPGREAEDEMQGHAGPSSKLAAR